MQRQKHLGKGTQNIQLWFEVQKNDKKRHPIVFGFKAGYLRRGGKRFLKLFLCPHFKFSFHSIPQFIATTPLSLFQALNEFLCEAQVEQLYGGELGQVREGLQQPLPAQL